MRCFLGAATAPTGGGSGGGSGGGASTRCRAGLEAGADGCAGTGCRAARAVEGVAAVAGPNGAPQATQNRSLPSLLRPQALQNRLIAFEFPKIKFASASLAGHDPNQFARPRMSQYRDMRFHRVLPSLAASLLAASVAASAQAGTDPIGLIGRSASFDRAHSVMQGVDATGRPVCYFRETGDSHHLDIGIGMPGAFVRLDTPEPREATARGPVRVFAGLQQVENGKATDRFMALATFDGPVEFHVPRGDQLGFVLVAGGDAAAVLAVVAAARPNFLVVESRQPPVVREYVGVSDFDASTAQALLACAKRYVH